MKRYLLIILPVIIFASCVKDRIAPPLNIVNANTDTTTSIVNSSVVGQGDSLLYFWNFNGADSTKKTADYFRTGLPAATYKYYISAGGYIDFTTGTSVNRQQNDDSGKCLRVRNPSDSLIFSLPTTGYKNIKFQFAEERTNSGSDINLLYYTVDGTNYISKILSNNAYNLDTTFEIRGVDLSPDTLINNNPKFAVKIVFNHNNTGTSGNDRFDNVSLFGIKE